MNLFNCLLQDDEDRHKKRDRDNDGKEREPKRSKMDDELGKSTKSKISNNFI